MKCNILTAFLLILPFYAGAQQRPGPWTPDSAVAVSSLRDSVHKVMHRFEKQVRQFEKEDSVAMPKTGGILFTGSSSIRAWKTLATEMAPLPVVRRGFGGSTFPEMIHYAPRLVYPYKPKAIVLYCGENDMTLDYSRPEDVLVSFREMDSLRRVYLPGTTIFYVSMKPSPRSWFFWPKIRIANALVESYIASDTTGMLHYIDITGTLLDKEGNVLPGLFYKDGIHINAEAYLRWTAIIKPQLLAFWEREQKKKPVNEGN